MTMKSAILFALCVTKAAGACLDPQEQYGECCGKLPNTGKPTGTMPTLGIMDAGCLFGKCGLESVECVGNSQCRQMLECYAECRLCNVPGMCETTIIDEEVPSCDFFCGMYLGANSTVSKKMTVCLQQNSCMHGPAKQGGHPYPPCGKCHIVPERDGVKNLTSMNQILGDWWVVGGLNYVYDAYPCDMCRWYEWEKEPWNLGHETGVVNRVTWNNSVPYTAIKNKCIKEKSVDCGKGIVQVEAMPTAKIIVPGVLHHNYTTPLTGFKQLENWTVVSWPHPDWMFVQWCGENFALDYAGAIVLAKYPNVDFSTAPPGVLESFAAAAKGIDFKKDVFEVKNGACPYEGGPRGSRETLLVV